MKHAYLILAHHEFALLQILVSCLDDSRNDIYIHFDRKLKSLPGITVQKAGLYMLNERVDVRWGDVSQIRAEYALLEAAIAHGPYMYYHFLSGVDLPLKSQDFIHDFFYANQGREFIGYSISEMTPQLVRKVQRWHLFPRHFKSQSVFVKAPRAMFIRIQELLGIKRNRKVTFKKGPNWVSITEPLARYVIDNKKWALKTFRNTFCGDELFIQTLCWNSAFRNKVYDAGSNKGCLREIGWKDGRLIDWSAKDLAYLKSSPALFARKFNSSDMDFIRAVAALGNVNQCQ